MAHYQLIFALVFLCLALDQAMSHNTHGSKLGVSDDSEIDEANQDMLDREEVEDHPVVAERRIVVLKKSYRNRRPHSRRVKKKPSGHGKKPDTRRTGKKPQFRGKAWKKPVPGWRKPYYSSRRRRRPCSSKPKPRRVPRCGRRPYHPRFHQCCSGVLHRRRPHQSCCGRRVYNSLVAFCQKSVHPLPRRGHHSLCNGKPYDRRHAICIKGKVHPKPIPGKHHLCCKRPYNVKSHFCFKCIVAPRAVYRICGEKLYSFKTSFCYKNCIFGREKLTKCGGHIILKDKYVCTKNTIKLRTDSSVAAKRESIDWQWQLHTVQPPAERKRVVELPPSKLGPHPALAPLRCQKLIYI
eukprot:gene18928-20832_t